MIRIRVQPEALNDELAASDAAVRLRSGDLLDQATYGSSLVGVLIREARDRGATRVEIEVDDAGEIHDAMAAANGLTRRRELLKMWRELPADRPGRIRTRPFVVGRDEDDWLVVNNRAFAWHPDQADRDRASLERLEAEPWFDPEGFLLHEEDDRLAGFCWTKVHADERPAVGEIYVIAVDPDFHGRGLGRELVLAGLDTLAAHDLRNAILYVEGTNDAARALYEDLGFVVIETHRWWTIDL